MLTAAAEMGAQSEGNNVEHVQEQPPPTTSVSAYSQPLLSSSYTPQMDIVPDGRITDPTTARTLDNVKLTREDIDELFQLYVWVSLVSNQANKTGILIVTLSFSLYWILKPLPTHITHNAHLSFGLSLEFRAERIREIPRC